MNDTDTDTDTTFTTLESLGYELIEMVNDLTGMHLATSTPTGCDPHIAADLAGAVAYLAGRYAEELVRSAEPTPPASE